MRPQEQEWAGEFGLEYTKRCDTTYAESLEHTLARYGVGKADMAREFLGDLDLGSLILEVGAGSGKQLVALRTLGFHRLFGIDIQESAVEMANETYDLNVKLGSAYAIPYPDDCFDLVFTSGLLIHIPPEGLSLVMDEIYRCSKKWIWGFESFWFEELPITYRGKKDLMWLGDFSRMYFSRFFPSVEVVKEKVYKALDTEKEEFEVMFLLKKEDTQ